MIVLLKGNLHNLCSPPSLVGSQSREEFRTDRVNPPVLKKRERSEVTNHNIATKWVEAPEKLQVSIQDTESQLVNVLGRQFCNQLKKNAAFHFN